MNKDMIRQKLIEAGVRNLKEFGYPSCNEQNILTDTVFKRFFLGMLPDNIGKMGADVDTVINQLILELKA